MGIPENPFFDAEPENLLGAFAPTENTKGQALKELDALDQQDQVAAMYDELRVSLYSSLSSMGLTTAEMEDVVQEAFLRLVHRLRQKDGKKTIRGWLFRVAHNLAMDIHRDMGRENAVEEEVAEMLIMSQVDPALNPEQRILQEEQMNRLNAAIRKLNPQQQLCLTLRYEGLNYDEMGMVMNVSPQRAAFQLRRSLLQLAELCG